MTATRSQLMRQPLHLNIDPFPPQAAHYRSMSSDPSPSSTHSQDVSSTPDSIESDEIMLSVLCMFDFQSNDPVHLSFHRNEILEVVKQEDSGWWAAMRQGGDTIGWIPQGFVKPLAEDMAQRLRNAHPSLRVYEYEAEQLYVSAPTVPILPPEAENEPWSPSENTLSSRRQYPPSPVAPIPQPPPRPGQQLSRSLDHRDQSPSRRDRSVSAPVPRNSPRPRNNLPVLPEVDSRRASSPARTLLAEQPWYLRPKHLDRLVLDNEGQVRSGPLVALVERLVSDTHGKDHTKTAQYISFRNAFLMTFRTFTTADTLFEMLVDCYRMEHPPTLTAQQFEEWREKLYSPTQRLVLEIFTVWLEEHRLLEEEPHISSRMRDFLMLITSPPQSTLAMLIIRTIERLTFSTGRDTAPQSLKKRSGKTHRGDLLRLEPADIAEQLALIEHSLYKKITPQECLRHSKAALEKRPTNLSAFIANHDRLAAWVQSTILNNEALGRRADTVDFWIKVAEKCKTLNNFASMSAVVIALSSTVISRLHLTWAHVGRKSTLDALIKYNDPTGGFAAYRTLQQHPDGPCVPFVGMYLTDIVHISDQFSDSGGNVNFMRCHRWYEAVGTMLRAQSKAYMYAENGTQPFIINALRGMSTADRNQTTLWEKSQVVQTSELAHADIRRGLEAAGF